MAGAGLLNHPKTQFMTDWVAFVKVFVATLLANFMINFAVLAIASAKDVPALIALFLALEEVSITTSTIFSSLSRTFFSHNAIVLSAA